MSAGAQSYTRRQEQCLRSECLLFRLSLCGGVDQHCHCGVLGSDSKVGMAGWWFLYRRSRRIHGLKEDQWRLLGHRTSGSKYSVECPTVMGLLGVFGSGVEGVPRTWLPLSDTRTRHALHRETHTLTTSVQVCSFAIFGNFEVNKNCRFWQFLDSIITDENPKYCQKWQKSELSSL